MKKQVLILTDVMMTGHHYFYGNYIRMNSLLDYDIRVVDDYYRLPNNIDQYDKKIAFICTIFDNYTDNKEYREDLERRIQKLKDRGFVFITASPWESKLNAEKNRIILNYQKHCFTSWYGGVDWFWFFMYYRHVRHLSNINPNHNTAKKYDFLYLNKLAREHRVLLYNRIKETDLLQNSLYSFLGLKTPARLPKEYEGPWIENGVYQDGNMNGQDQDFYEKQYNDSNLSIITESNVSSDEDFITEKIWKAIIMKHPFVVLGNTHTLKKLKSLGFKTFNNVWDESYDDETAVENKISKIISVCNQLKENNFKDLYSQTEDAREHNFQWFFDRDNISRVINDRLLSWLQ